MTESRAYEVLRIPVPPDDSTAPIHPGDPRNEHGQVESGCRQRGNTWWLRVMTVMALLPILWACAGSTADQNGPEPDRRADSSDAGQDGPVRALDSYPVPPDECLCSVAKPRPAGLKAAADSAGPLAQGIRAFRSGDLKTAVGEFGAAIEADPDSAMAYFDRGTTFLEIGELDLAAADFDGALEREPNDPVTHLNRGIAAYRQGAGEEAIAHFDAALSLRGDYGLALWNRGFVLSMRDEFGQALRDFDAVILLEPDSAINYLGRGIVHADMRDLGKARADFEVALALNTDPDLTRRIQTALDWMP